MKVPKYIKEWLKLREHHAMMTITYDNKISLCENGSHLAAISAIENFQPKKGESK